MATLKVKKVTLPKNGKFISLKDLQASKKTISIDDVRSIFNTMIKEIEFPSIVSRLPNHVKYRDTIEIKFKNYPIPVLNLYDGTVEVGKSSKQRAPVFATFNGESSPIIVEVKQKLVNKSFLSVVPDGALSGPVIMFFPFQVKYGIDIFNKIKEYRDDKLQCPEGFTTNQETTVIRYFPVIMGYLQISCGLCNNQETSICQYGAIKFTPQGDCYIDQSICKGQWCELTNNGNPRNRLEEHKCWECFNGTEHYSSKCLQHSVSRVLFIDSPCCGCCGPFATVIPGVCLRELCEFGAIEGGNGLDGNRCGQVNSGDGTWGGHYRVEQKKCIGCMKCYLNVNCQNVMMKAFIKPRYESTVLIRSIEFIPNENFDITRLDQSLKIYLGVFGQNSNRVFHHEIPLSKSIIGNPMELNKKYNFIENLYLSIYLKHQDSLIPRVMIQNLHDFINDFSSLIGIISANPALPTRIDNIVEIKARPYGSFKVTFNYQIFF